MALCRSRRTSWQGIELIRSYIDSIRWILWLPYGNVARDINQDNLLLKLHRREVGQVNTMKDPLDFLINRNAETEFC